MLEFLKIVIDVVSFLANLLTIITACLALYLYRTKGPALSAAISMLVNFSFQTTLGELREKLERLNEYHADDAVGNQEIVNIFHELHGQICGNARVLAAMPELADKLEKMLKSTKPIAEPRKRAMVSELREVLKNLNVGSIENYVGAN